MLVLHDNDMMVPADYAREILARAAQGYEVMNLKRFIFYLTETHTKEVLADTAEYTDKPSEAIVQNLEGGGSVAIARDAFNRIGGMDESFVGWGGEDNEFWERAQTCRVWPYGYLPLVHLWHQPQPEKHRCVDNGGAARYDRLRALPPRRPYPDSE
jgi:GT2 family glycosyltransferase